MDEDDRGPDETSEEESFADLLQASSLGHDRLEPGQMVEAVIVKITAEWVFLDLGGKSEGCLDKKELLDEKGQLAVKEGDTIRAYFLTFRDGQELFTTKVTGGQAARTYLEEAWRGGIPVEGLVEKENKGGFQVKIAGTLRGFCPFSQMSLQRVQDSAQFVGQHLPFKILEYAESGRTVVLSHRAILEEEQEQKKEALKASLQEGMTVQGKVTSIRDFGAFVEIGGVQGLIPASEIGWDRGVAVQDVLAVGQEVTAAVLKLDWEKGRITLSLKKTLADPWEEIRGRFPEGSFHAGKVVRLTQFGAFVNLGPGVDGLIHISNLAPGKRIRHPREILAEGQEIQVKVEKVEQERRRLSLSLVSPDKDEEETDKDHDYRRYTEAKPRSMGTLGEILMAKLAEKAKKRSGRQ
jgi:small subunit ribosomal protein S1